MLVINSSMVLIIKSEVPSWCLSSSSSPGDSDKSCNFSFSTINLGHHILSADLTQMICRGLRTATARVLEVSMVFTKSYSHVLSVFFFSQVSYMNTSSIGIHLNFSACIVVTVLIEIIKREQLVLMWKEGKKMLLRSNIRNLKNVT